MGVNASEMVSGTEYDLGNGFTISPWDIEGRRVGYFITGPAPPACKSPYEGRCGGLVPILDLKNVDMPERPVWNVVSENPLELSPSVACPCDGQHGHVQGGRWV